MRWLAYAFFLEELAHNTIVLAFDKTALGWRRFNAHLDCHVLRIKVINPAHFKGRENFSADTVGCL